MPNSYFRAWSADETLSNNAKKAFNHFIAKSGFDDELESEELEAFKARFVDDVSRLVEEKRFLSYSGEKAKGIWRDILKEAAAEEKPVVTKAFVDDINSRHLGFTVRMRGWMQNFSALDLEHELGGLDLNDEELSEEDQTMRRLSGRRSLAGSVPTSFDVREEYPHCEDVCSRPLSQGRCASCWAFAGLLVTDCRLCIATNGDFSGKRAILSRTVAATCGKDYGCSLGSHRRCHDDGSHDGCANGGSVRWVYGYIANRGLPTGGESGCIPYFGHGDGREHFDFQEEAPPCTLQCVSQYSRPYSSDVIRLNHEYRSDRQKWSKHQGHMYKQVIYGTGPVAALVNADRAFKAYDSGVFNSGCDQSTNHYVVVTGWGLEGKREFYSVVNSWDSVPFLKVAPCVLQEIDVPGDIDLSKSSLPSPLFGKARKGCHTTDGTACVFPFTYVGVTYVACTSVDNNVPWCSTRTGVSGNHVSGYYGNCGADCQAVPVCSMAGRRIKGQDLATYFCSKPGHKALAFSHGCASFGVATNRGTQEKATAAAIDYCDGDGIGSVGSREGCHVQNPATYYCQ